jgi:hypothetical protein
MDLAAAALLFVTIASLTLAVSGGAAPAPAYPPSPVIAGMEFDTSTIRIAAPGSDNWAVTWADDDHQYTSWGDGGGFGGSNEDGRVSLGFGRVEGGPRDYCCYNIWGGKDPVTPAEFEGKCYGLLSIDGVLYAWCSGSESRGGSDSACFGIQQVYVSGDHAVTWEPTAVRFTPDSFPNSHGFFTPTFLQFGRDYDGARDDHVYSYAPEIVDPTDWNVQTPGGICLMRAPKGRLVQADAYEFFAGFDENKQPLWTDDVAEREPVFSDHANGVMRTSVSYNPGLDRYLLITQQVDRYREKNGHIGIYDAPEPWGPWTPVLFENAWETGLQSGRGRSGTRKTVYWNFSNKWLSDDGLRFVLVYTGDSEQRASDNWTTIDGRFATTGDRRSRYESR